MRIFAAYERVRLRGKHVLDRACVPLRGRNEVVQLLEIVRGYARSKRLNALAITRGQQPAQVNRSPLATDLVPEGVEKGLQPPIELLLVLEFAAALAIHARLWSAFRRRWKEKNVAM